MKTRTWAATVLALLLLAAAPSHAAIVFVDLGTGPPPTTIGPVSVLPFSLAPQAAIPNFTSVIGVPGNPFGGDAVTFSTSAFKVTVPDGGWGTWSHGFQGPVFFVDANSVTLFLPTGSTAFYLYVEPNVFDFFDVTATATDGTTSGPIPVNGLGGANGFGFFSTVEGQSIATIRIDVDPAAGGFAIGEFGISNSGSAHVPTLSEWGMILFVSLLLIGALRQLSRKLA